MKKEFFDPDLVHDRDSFMQFAQWLITDRQEAELYLGLFRNSEAFRRMQADQGFKPTPDGAT